MLLRAIESVKKQSFIPFEIIVVDDGSTDGTSNLFPMNGVVYKKIEHSGFPGNVRNIGVELSTGEYVAFLDSDDVWLPRKLELQENYFSNNPGCRLLHTKEQWNMNGKIISQKKRKHKRFGDVFIDSLQGCILGPSTVLMDKVLFNQFNGFNPKIEVGEDYDLWLRITNSINIDYIDQELIVKYAGHGDQLSFKYGYIEPFKIDVLENLLLKNYFSEKNREYAINSLIGKYNIIINGCLKRSKDSEASEFEIRKNNLFSKLKIIP